MELQQTVSAIKKGTVIDHIPQGQALRIIYLLSLQNSKLKVISGMNLPSKRFKFKDLIKIENHMITEEEANTIVVFAPEATINLIENFKVKKKLVLNLPTEIKNVFICLNPVCISQNEPVKNHFYISETNNQVQLTCHYCEKIFPRDKIKVNL